MHSGRKGPKDEGGGRVAASALNQAASLNTTQSPNTRGINVNVQCVSGVEQKTFEGTEPLDGTVTRRIALPVSEHVCTGLWRNWAILRLCRGFRHNSRHLSLADIHRLVLLPGELSGRQDALSLNRAAE